ncbi:MAG TPA: hypothetical protein VGR47_12475 [Terracidiphilus sp.]|nr:hypothetical protein [Terracidiphilus sp.]
MRKYTTLTLFFSLFALLANCYYGPARLFAQTPSSQLPSAPIPSLCITCAADAAWNGVVPVPSAPEDVASANPAPAGAQTPRHAPTKASKEKNKKGQVYSPTATTGSPKHMYWVIPAYKVNYGKFQPLSPHEKFQEWAQSTYDPLGLGATAVEAGTLEYSSSDGFCGYGHGWAGYGKCFGSMELDATDSSFFGDYVFTIWWHQDPRYFRLGKGGFTRRTVYAISRVFITFNDSGKNVFYSSGLSGTSLAGIVSNLYYPKQDRGVSLTISRIGIDLANTALYNGAAEFWPDIDHWVDKTF